MNRKLRDFLRIRGQTWKDTLKIRVNLFVHVSLRAVLRASLRNRPEVVRWIETHPHLYWTRFPFSLEGRTVWNPWLQAWADDWSLHWCSWNDFPEIWFVPKSGDFVVDVGAHRGYWTLQVSRLVGKDGLVVAVEPHPDNFRYLLRHLAINEVNNCIPVKAACWNRGGRIFLVGERPERHGVDPRGFEPGSLPVIAVTIDGLAEGLSLDRVNWIKCDVEGAECEVLEGARQVLRAFRPTLLVEVHGTWERLTALLDEVGYSIAEVQRDPVHPDWRGFVLARPRPVA